MATKHEELQRIRREYMARTGKKEIDHREVAKFAIKLGWPRPRPKDPIDILAKEISEAARIEEGTDKVTGLPYRANLAYSVMQGGEQLTFWVVTDDATRSQLVKAKTKFRDQLVGEAFRLGNTLDHWNRTHPNEEPVQADLDLGPDVEWMRNTPKDDKKAS